MGWLGDVFKGIATGAATTFGGGLAGVGVNALLGNPSDKELREQALGDRKEDFRHQRRLLTLGNQQDLANQQAMFDYRIEAGLERGMTPYQMFMGPAAGAGGGTTGSGPTLGNAANQAQMNEKQIAKERLIAQKERNLDRVTDLTKTAMQTDAQRDVARTAAGATTGAAETTAAATRYKADVDDKIAKRIYDLNDKRLDAELKQMAMQLQISEQDLKVRTNDVATSDPKFKVAMKQLSMGPANMLTEMTLRHHGVSFADDSFMKKSKAERERILNEVTALTAKSYVEAHGAAEAGSQILNAWNNILNHVLEVLGITNRTDAIEQPGVPTLGKNTPGQERVLQSMMEGLGNMDNR